MHTPRKNRLIYFFFSWYINRIIRSDFDGLEFKNITFDPQRPVLLIANHFSWWDGFIMFCLNLRHFKKKFHVMVTEDNYRQHWFLKYLGAFSVRKNSRNIIETLEYAGTLLNDPDNLVLIFPQGKLYSGHTGGVVFEKGLLNLVNSSSKNFQYLFAATFVDYFDKRRPRITCYLQNWEAAEFTSLQLIKSAYNKHYQASLQQQCANTV